MEAREVGVASGAKPVLWRLITTEPIDTNAQIENIIDAYRRRWLIEEFFKALKTGCRFESHQLEGIKGLLVALAIESAVAWQLLRLRYVARHQPHAHGAPLLSDAQHRALLHLRRSWGQTGEDLSVEDVAAALARLGVHLRNNGPPGWLVLKRGLRKLTLLAEGLSLADPLSSTGYDVINL